MGYKDFFKSKRIAVVGVGEHGSMLPDIRFLLKLKACVSIYDIRSRDKLGGDESGSVAKEIENICIAAQIGAPASCQFGLIGLMSDAAARKSFENELAESDLIILAPDISRSSGFLKQAITAGVRIEYSDTLLFKLIPSTMLVGVMGSAGKSAVSAMLYDILRRAGRKTVDAETDEVREETRTGAGVFHVDVESGDVLSALKKIKKDDIIIARMPEHLMDEYRIARITPHVAVLTHVSKSLAEMGKEFFGILEFQTYNSFIVASDLAVDMLKKSGGFQPRAKIIRTRPATIPSDWHIRMPNAHARDNATLAIEAALIFKIEPDIIHLALADVKQLKGRLEKVRTSKNGVEFYNDSMSARPEATLAALRALGATGERRSIVLIMGGSYTGVSYEELISHIPQYVSTLILLPGSGTLTERQAFEKLADEEQPMPGKTHPKVSYVKTIAEGMAVAQASAGKGDRVLFSPAFDIVGFESKLERGEEFIRLVKGIH
ncbi:MAG: UDP-N-acetylmuramoyl-L-alanine--D-glutamate ligase [Candidatus Taylorbacteria bacterium]|nr:UDP-N-acetylmuramoyl-L-alanine--D-glutamate ligase [Candidatus Taylorbacteria bacterium]